MSSVMTGASSWSGGAEEEEEEEENTFETSGGILEGESVSN